MNSKQEVCKLLKKLKASPKNLLGEHCFDQSNQIISSITNDAIVKLNPKSNPLVNIQGISRMIGQNYILDIRHAACVTELIGTKCYQPIMALYLRDLVTKLSEDENITKIQIDIEFLTDTTNSIRNKCFRALEKFCDEISSNVNVIPTPHKMSFDYESISDEKILQLINKSLMIVDI